MMFLLLLFLSTGISYQTKETHFSFFLQGHAIWHFCSPAVLARLGEDCSHPGLKTGGPLFITGCERQVSVCLIVARHPGRHAPVGNLFHFISWHIVSFTADQHLHRQRTIVFFFLKWRKTVKLKTQKTTRKLILGLLRYRPSLVWAELPQGQWHCWNSGSTI